MSWFVGDLPSFIPVCRKFRQTVFAKEYPVELWDYQAVCKDKGEGVREWAKEATQEGRSLALHFYIPGTKLDRLYDHYRDYWHKAWKEAANYVKFSLYPEFDCWYDAPLLEGKRLQYRTRDLAQDMHDAGMKMIWLLLETREGGSADINYYADYANSNHMRWVTHNLTGARQKSVFIEQLQVYASYNKQLHKDIGVIINGPSSEPRIRAVRRVFEGREVVITNAAKIEFKRRGFA